jgi:hypothetical protein
MFAATLYAAAAILNFAAADVRWSLSFSGAGGFHIGVCSHIRATWFDGNLQNFLVSWRRQQQQQRRQFRY